MEKEDVTSTKKRHYTTHKIGHVCAHEFHLEFYTWFDDTLLYSKDMYCTKYHLKTDLQNTISLIKEGRPNVQFNVVIDYLDSTETLVEERVDESAIKDLDRLVTC